MARAPVRAGWAALLLAATLALPAAARPHVHADPLTQHDRRALQAQVQHAERQDWAPREAAVVYVGAALDDASTAFIGDVRATDTALKALAPHHRSLTLANLPTPRRHAARPAALPRATRTSLGTAVARASELLQAAPAGTPRLAVVLLSSHGAPGWLSLETPQMREPASLKAERIAQLLRPLGDTPTLLVISACHAGSLIPALHAPNRIILAAARADRSSFGCQPDSHNTYFVEELLQALKPERSLQDWFDATAIGVGAREQRMGLSPPSLPQIDVGEAMVARAQQPIANLFAPPAP
jgi:hypothetical protein